MPGVNAVEGETELSRQVVLEFCRRLGEPDLAGMFSLMHDDATWTMVGDPEKCFFGGVHSKQKVNDILVEFIGAFDRFSFAVLHSFAEGENVAVRGVSHGVRPDGHEYRNDYLMQYTVKDGKVASVVEFFNPLQVFKYLGVPAPL